MTSALSYDKIQWYDISQLSRQQKHAKAANLEPRNVVCRHNPEFRKSLLRPQIGISWMPNRGGVDWQIWVVPLGNKDEDYYQERWLSEFELGSRTMFVTGSKQKKFACEIWYKVDEKP